MFSGHYVCVFCGRFDLRLDFQNRSVAVRITNMIRCTSFLIVSLSSITMICKHVTKQFLNCESRISQMFCTVCDALNIGYYCVLFVRALFPLILCDMPSKTAPCTM